YADVTGSSLVGGIVGYVSAGAPPLDKDNRPIHGGVSECANYGTITATDSKSEFSPVGGIAGAGYASGRTEVKYGWQEASGTITNCYNAGTVRGPSKSVAGIVGEASTLKSALKGEEGHFSVHNCYNVGTIEGGNK